MSLLLQNTTPNTITEADLTGIAISIRRKGKDTYTICLYLEDRFQQKLSLGLKLESKDRNWHSVLVWCKRSYSCTNADISIPIYSKNFRYDSAHPDIHYWHFSWCISVALRRSGRNGIEIIKTLLKMYELLERICNCGSCICESKYYLFMHFQWVKFQVKPMLKMLIMGFP